MIIRSGIAISVFLLFVLVLSGCNTLPQSDSPAEVTVKVERAAEARTNLWAALQGDKGRFTAAEWARAESIHGRTIVLAADIEVGVSMGGMPPVETVKDWMLIGGILMADTKALLKPHLDTLTPETRTAWAIEKARLKALRQAGQRYLDNPDAETYRQLAKIGLVVGKAALGAIL